MQKFAHLLLMPTLLIGSIVETDSFDILEKILNTEQNEETLVITDIDNTLIKPTTQLGSVFWGESIIEELMYKGINPVQAQEIQNVFWKTVQPKLSVCPVDTKAPGIIQSIKEDSIAVIGLTARSIDESVYTQNQLKTVGIDFSKSVFSSEDQLDTDLYFQNGILFAGCFEKKFAVLFKFLDHKKYKPSKIVFIDDKYHHIQEMEEACNRRGISFEGIYFTKACKDDFNPNIADLQWEEFPCLLSDNEAQKKLEEKMVEKEILEKMNLSYQKQLIENPDLLWHESSSVLALIGNPVEKSKSALAHNAVIEAFSLNAIYLKIPLQAKELKTFFQLVRKMPFKGLSVTMPLKELVLPYLDGLSPEAKNIGAVNTILIKEGKLIGYNTDGEGAVQALENKTSLKNKKVIIIGAGGAAKAIAHTAANRGANIVILNRSLDKAEELAKNIGARANTLDKIEKYYLEGYDIIISCVPTPLPFDPKYILPKSIFMDIRSKQEEPSLISLAKEKGALIVYPQEMWVNQAVMQEQIWFNTKIEKNKAEEVISNQISVL